MTATSRRRPTDWQPLNESDPVPGDPEEIRAEVRHMVSISVIARAESEFAETLVELFDAVMTTFRWSYA
ncbi:hypothetical protein [Streptomyces sp. NPDC087212]|uniref:hypothetical protein n=1 Tax=Streptomyces sp. NPDC087212 TaxID=3365766 RepID=UPI00380DC0B5